MLMHIFNVGVGMTFSGGIIDLTLFGILQGNAKTNWINIVWVGILYFIVYYFLFRYLIKKFNFVTPGREDDETDTKLYTRKDVNAAKEDKSALILDGLGGKEQRLVTGKSLGNAAVGKRLSKEIGKGGPTARERAGGIHQGLVDLIAPPRG